MLCLVPLTLQNYKDLAVPGKRVISEIGYATVIADKQFTDGLTIYGWSVKEFVEYHKEVYIISEI